MRSPLLHPYPQAVLDTVRRRGLLSREDRVLVALSGGPDSTALLAALAALRDGGELAGLTALHVDHGLRPGEQDAACAAASCARLGVPLRTVAVTVAPGNVQAEARRARYARGLPSGQCCWTDWVGQTAATVSPEWCGWGRAG